MNYRNCKNLSSGFSRLAPLKKDAATPRRGEVWFVKNLEYAQKIGCKSRPVIVLGTRGSTVLFVECTSSSRRDYACLVDPVGCGLRPGTRVKNEICTAPASRFEFRYGILSGYDQGIMDLPRRERKAVRSGGEVTWC